MDVRRGVNYDLPLTLAEWKSYGGEEEAIDETPNPSWEDKEEVIGATRYNLDEHS